jgi:hypothetical protein
MNAEIKHFKVDHEKEYNEKKFLAADSIYSHASFHATICPELYAIFRIHDCNNGIKIWNNLNNPEEVQEMIGKMRVLGTAALSFATFIEDNILNETK